MAFYLFSIWTSYLVNVFCVVNKWIANLIASATKKMMEQKDERYVAYSVWFYYAWRINLLLILSTIWIYRTQPLHFGAYFLTSYTFKKIGDLTWYQSFGFWKISDLSIFNRYVLVYIFSLCAWMLGCWIAWFTLLGAFLDLLSFDEDWWLNCLTPKFTSRLLTSKS